EVGQISPGSWIDANFDIWIGHQEDLVAWELLREARAFYAREQQNRHQGIAGAPTEPQLARAYESLMAAEGSDWCWWFGPEHSTANDAEFDALFRKHLTEIYLALGREAPDGLAEPIKRKPERARVVPPSGYLNVVVDGREGSYFEWLGAGLYSANRRSGAMHGRAPFLDELRFGFNDRFLFVRVDPLPGSLAQLAEWEFRITVRANEEMRVVGRVGQGKLTSFYLERGDQKISGPQEKIAVAFDGILEVAIGREMFIPGPQNWLALGVALWHEGLPLDVLPAEGWLEIKLEEESFAWPRLG